MDKRDLLLVLYVTKSLSKAERDKADAYAGPGETFPLYKNGEHLAAAWDLAGRTKEGNPDEIRRNILNFAREHNLMHFLPASAQEFHMTGHTDADDTDGKEESDSKKGEELIEVAKSLPIMKSWSSGGITYIEGWISTPALDIEKDRVQPEAFQKAMDPYFTLGAPLTSEHQMKPMPERGVYIRYPVGHIQKAALVRDGHIFKEASHPTDSADFEHFPGMGTGVYGRSALTDPLAAEQVAKGNVRGFSWVGRVKTKPLPGGRYDFTEVVAWQESTIAAFPINQEATILARS